MGSPRKPRALLLGLDGATFSLLDQLASQQVLPGYSRWRAEGASGPLRSTNPPTTPPAWSSCVTGLNPGGHGVYDFRESFHLDRERPLVTGRSIRAPRVWDFLGDSGRRSCVLNFPLIWPPDQLEGVMVCGMTAPEGGDRLAWPEDEWPRLQREVPGYRPNIDIPAYDVDFLAGARGFLDELERSLDARIAAFWHYFEREDWDFYFPTFVFHDRLGHLFWKLMTGEDGFAQHPFAAELRPRIEAVYRRFDAMIEELLERRPAELSLFMCSDHGFGGTRGFFEVNAWLREMGLLRLRRRAQVRSMAFYRAMELGDQEALRRALPERLQVALRGKLRSRRSSFKDALSDTVDWSHSEALFVSVPQQGITILRQPGKVGEAGCSRSHYDALRRRIKEALVALRGPDGEPMVDEVWDREELYHGPCAHLAPDLVFRCRDYSWVGRPILGAARCFKDNADRPSGFHRMDGVWMALGDGIEAGAKVQDATIADVCPTVLYAMGELVPDGLDGRVLESSWSSQWRDQHPVSYQSRGGSRSPAARPSSVEAGGREHLAERLAALGYLDLR